MKVPITYSQLRTLKECPYKHHLKYNHGITPTHFEENLHIGSLIHVFMDMRAKGIDFQEARDIVRKVHFSSMPNGDDEAILEHRILWSKLFAMLYAYDWRWAETDTQFLVVASELEFNVPIYNPETGRPSRSYTLSGKIDRLVRLPGGNLVIWECKTTSEDLDAGSAFWRRLRLEAQPSVYVLAARELGYDVTGVIFDVIRKPAIRPRQLTQSETRVLIDTGEYRTSLSQGSDAQLIVREVPIKAIPDAETPGEIWVDQDQALLSLGVKGYSIRETPDLFSARCYQLMVHNPDTFFARREIARTERDIEEIRRELWIQTQILLARRPSYWEKNDRACVTFSSCPYLNLCSDGFKPETDALPEGFVRLEKFHQELEETHDQSTSPSAVPRNWNNTPTAEECPCSSGVTEASSGPVSDSGEGEGANSSQFNAC